MKINAKRFLENLHTLKTFTDTPGEGVTRFSYGNQDRKAREYILKRAENAGCTVSIDALQNIKIGLKSNKDGLPSVIAGSHIDTVRNGGWLDGIYGVCGALEVMETLSENLPGKPSEIQANDLSNSADAGRQFHQESEALHSSGSPYSCNYEMVIFAEEEGSGFGSTMTGSKFIAGIYEESDLDKLKNDDDKTLRKVLEDTCGEKLSANDIKNVLWDFDNIKTMLELHIEQGPVLDREGLSMGIVDSIFGMRVIEVTLTGIGNHAGATPMNERYDALCAAAECILTAEKIVKSDTDRRTVVTAGKMEIQPNCSNVIPEKVKFTIEVRDKDEKKINKFTDGIIDSIKNIAAARKVSYNIKEHSKSAPLHLSDRLINSMSNRAESKKLSYKVMDSGAVHDACMIASHADTGMIFVPSINGRSHVPEEDTKEEDLICGCQFLLDTVIDELK